MKTLDLKFSLAGALRLLGAVAVVGSGIIYMLQGLDTIDMQLRNWAYLILMLVLAVGGISSFSLLEDRKGARLFFMLAALVIPVQFSQLGGMLFNYVGGGVGNLFAMFQFTEVSRDSLLLTSGLSLLAAGVVGFASFSILARPYARWLVSAFIVSNLLILVPVRALPAGLIVLAVMLALVLQLERKIFSRDVIFKTLEGLGARVLCALPLVIAFVRSAFHQQEYVGLCVLALMLALTVAQVSMRYLEKGQARESLLFAAWIIGAISSAGIAVWAVDSASFPSSISAVATPLILFIPFIVWTAWIAKGACALAGLYRLFAVVAASALTVLVFKEKTPVAMLTTGALGVMMITWGFIQRARIPIIAGALVAASSMIGLVVLSIQYVDVNIWLSLAVAGVVLVSLSSVAEKYGRRWLSQSRESLQSFSNWPA